MATHIINKRSLELAVMRSGLSDYELSSKSGIAPKTLYLARKNGRASTKTVYKIAQALNIDPKEFTEEERGGEEVQHE